MYNKLDLYLSGSFTEDYWFDEGYIIAREMLEQFHEEDWSLLFNNILSKSTDWQVRFAYCTDSGINDYYIIKLLLLLSNLNDRNLFETCIDSLRILIDVNNIKMISNETNTVERIKELFPKTNAVTKKMLEDFMQKIEEYKK